MAFKKRAETEDDVFMATFPLSYSPYVHKRLDTIFQCMNNVVNDGIQHWNTVIHEMERTREWRANQSTLAASYKSIEICEKRIARIDRNKKRMTAIAKHEDDPNYDKKMAIIQRLRARYKAIRPKYNAELKAGKKAQAECFAKRNEMIAKYKISKENNDQIFKEARKHYQKILHSAVVQKTADSVWKKVKAYLWGNGKEIKYSPIMEFTTISGKSNNTGITFDASKMEVSVYDKKNLTLDVRKTDSRDPYGYETEALSRNVHFVQLIRRWYPDGWHYLVQICFGGKPPIKVKPDTGEILYALGTGRAGIDPGTQTMAMIGEDAATLKVLAPHVSDIQAELRRINRAMDRSRRATNPKMFNEKGEIIRIDQLPEECVVIRHGKKYRNWNKSKRYLRLESYRRYLYRNQALNRQEAHNRLANSVLSYGKNWFCEKMNYSALSKRVKETKKSEKTGKFVSKKRFGKSLGNKAPATFLNVLSRKVEAQGGTFSYINTVKAKASQFDHTDKAYKKKHLGQRWSTLYDGTKLQRDLYSAFLIMCINDTLDGFNDELIQKNYQTFLKNHNKCISNLLSSSETLPSSMGIKASA